MRILLIEDDFALRKGLTETLEKQLQAVVDATDNGRDGLYYALEYPIDVAVIDLGLPQQDGLSIIKALREEKRHYPVLILTARQRWQDKVEGLEAGADDFLSKPFQNEELVARLRALYRRTHGQSTNHIECGDLCLDLQNHQAFVAGKAIFLTAYEYRLLEYFVLHRGRLLTKFMLTDHLYSEGEDRDSNVLEVLIGRLRRKLDPNSNKKPIVNIRNQGYRFEW
jgi:two-component system response regulator PhoP